MYLANPRSKLALSLCSASLLAIVTIASSSPAAYAEPPGNGICPAPTPCVDTEQIVDGAVTNPKLGADAVTTDKILDGTITADDIAAGVISGGIGTGDITTTEILDETIQAIDIGPGAVTASEIATGAVGTAELASGSVTAAEIAAGAVGTSEIATDGVGAAEIAADAVGTSEIATGAVGTAELAADAVTTAEISNGTVGTADLADDAVTTPNILDGAVTAAKLAPGLLSTGNLFTNTIFVSPDDGCDVAAGSLTDALASITDNSAANPYLIKLEPGIYDCGTARVVMKSYVDIEGSGRDITVIEGTVADPDGLVELADQSELRNLKVSVSGTSALEVVGVGFNSNSSSSLAKLRSLNVLAINSGTGDAIGAKLGSDGRMQVHDSLVQGDGDSGLAATAFGVLLAGDFDSASGDQVIEVWNRTLIANNASAKIGLDVDGSSRAFVRNSDVIGGGGTGSTGVRLNHGTATSVATARIGASRLIGATLVNEIGTADGICVASFDQSFGAISC